MNVTHKFSLLKAHIHRKTGSPGEGLGQGGCDCAVMMAQGSSLEVVALFWT